MARAIKLTFTNSQYVTDLINDNDFLSESAYLKPHKHNDDEIIFYDPLESHSIYDTEVVVLTLVGHHLKRIRFSTVNKAIEFNTPFITILKGGIKIGKTIIVSDTDVRL